MMYFSIYNFSTIPMYYTSSVNMISANCGGLICILNNCHPDSAVTSELGVLYWRLDIGD